LAITWLTSFEQLGEAARTLLRRLAWLSPAPIPESLLEVPIAGEAPNPDGAFDALVELESLSLLKRSDEAPQLWCTGWCRRYAAAAGVGAGAP
jgi:hypothetical protein